MNARRTTVVTRPNIWYGWNPYRNRRLEIKPREIEVHIEELILHGFEPASRWRIADALQQELRGLLAAEGVPSLWLSNPERIEAGTISSASTTKSTQAGAEIAGAAYRGGLK